MKNEKERRHFSKKKEDLSTLGVLNFSWTPPLFFQVPGTMHKKVKEIMGFFFFFFSISLHKKISAIENYSLGRKEKKEEINGPGPALCISHWRSGGQALYKSWLDI